MHEKFKRAAVFLTACLPALIYITWINAYYWLLEGGRYQAFVQPKLWPLLILAMILLLAYSAAFISQFTLKVKISFRSDVWLKAAILFLPALFLWTIYGQSLGADAFAKRVINADRNVPMQDTYLMQHPSAVISGNAPTLLDLMFLATPKWVFIVSDWWLPSATS